MIERSTVVIADRLAHHRVTLDAARHSRHGRRVTTLAGLAARLAGPFTSVADDIAVRRTLSPIPTQELTTLKGVADLPGFPRAAANALRSVWNADLDLGELAAAQGGRWNEIAALERQVLERLSPGVFTPRGVVDAAVDRAHLAPTIAGDVTLDGLDHVPPVYRRLLEELAKHVEVRWLGPTSGVSTSIPNGVQFESGEASSPHLSRVECADPQHEVVEAFRWARALLASGEATPDQIGIAAASTETYEDAVLALAEESNLPVHAARGIPALSGRDGQVVAALADVLIRGLDRVRVRRFVSAAKSPGSGAPDLVDLPDDWSRVLHRDAPLSNIERWERSLAPQDDDMDAVRDTLRQLGKDLARGNDGAAEIGERWLRGRPRLLWRRALDEGPAAAVDVSLDRLRVDDGVDPAAAILWAPAAMIAGSPRKHVRLLGLASRSWPRRSADDPLLPKHILGDVVLQERTLAQTDRAHFAAILERSDAQVVLSRARRGADGRKLAPSPLLRGLDTGEEVSLMPRRLPEYAFSEGDRRLARPRELAHDEHARSALATWRAWQQDGLTAHDGIVRQAHPAIARALDRVHSATSLRALLRNPIAFVWRYAFGWSEPSDLEEGLVLDPLQRGTLLHETLEEAVRQLEAGPGLAHASDDDISEAARSAVSTVADAWSIAHPVPPQVLWLAALEEARQMAETALGLRIEALPGQRSFVEVPFGLADAEDSDEADKWPWVPTTEVRLGEDRLRIQGRIDRLDLSGDGRQARVVDYKSSRNPRKPADRLVDINEGQELQRCLYAFAVRDLLPDVSDVDALLVYPATSRVDPIADAQRTLDGLANVVSIAAARLREGYAVPGPDAESTWFDLRLALPADLNRGYERRKREAIAAAREPIDAILKAEPGSDAPEPEEMA